jgi:hypothetical protein
MIRDEQFHSSEGQSAWLYYQTWMKAYNRIVPKPSSFLHSKFFNAFFRFAEFVKKVRLPEVDAFIRMMRTKKISPVNWTSDVVYGMYLEHVDRRLPPLRHADFTIATLFDLADDYNVDLMDIFEHVSTTDIIHLFRQRRLSPWLMLNSNKFKRFFKEKLSLDERIILQSIIRPEFWGEKFKTNPKMLQKMKEFAKELDL